MYSIPEVAKKLKKTRYFVWRLVQNGKLKADTWKGSKRNEYSISEASLKTFMETYKWRKGRGVKERARAQEAPSEPKELPDPEV